MLFVIIKFMEIVNNRYKIIREIHQDNIDNVLSFAVLDLLTENNILGLSIIRLEDLPTHSEKFIKQNFTHILTMHNNRFFKDYEFGRTDFEIGGTNKKVYYFTHEIYEDCLSLYDFIDPFNLSDILSAIVQICQCQNLAIRNGYLQSVDKLDDFFAINEGNNFSVKARDLISISLHSKNQDSDYHFENIAYLFLSFFDGYAKTRNILENIEQIKDFYREAFLTDYENKILDCILKVCENIYLGKYGNIIYSFYYKLIADINAELNSFFCADVDNVNSYVVKHPRLFSEAINVTNIINEITDTTLKSKHKCFLVTGNLGTGKSAFLVDLAFLLNFENVDIYSLEIDTLSYKFFLKLLSQILDKYPVLKSEVDLNDLYLHMKSFTSENRTDFESMFGVIEKINNIIKKASSMRPQIIIAYNLNLADKFTLEFIFSNIAQDLTGVNTFFVFSFSKDFANSKEYFEVAYKEILKHNSCLEIKLNLLTELETAILVKNMLGMQEEPVITAKEINKVTGGNQFFTIQLITSLLDAGELWKNREDGYWEVKSGVYQISHFFETPKAITELAKTVFERYFTLNLDVLKIISIFQIYIKKSFIKDLIYDIDDYEVEKLFNNFIKNNFLYEIKKGIYRVDEKILQRTFYSLLTDSEKKRLHMRALEILKKENDEIFYDEILIHYDYLGEEENLLSLLLTKAHNEIRTGDYQSAIINYEKALFTLNDRSADMKMKIGTELAASYLNLGKLDFSLQTFNSLEYIIPKITDKKTLLMFYIAYAELAYKLADAERFYELLKEIEILRHEDIQLKEYEKNLLEKIYVFNNMFAGDKNEIIKSLEALIFHIDKSGINKQMLSELYRFMGNIKIKEKDIEAAREFYSISYQNAKKYNDAQNMLSALNNLANLNARFFENLKLAEQIYLESLKISSELAFEQNILVSYINISAIYYDMEQFEKSEHYLNLASEKIARSSFSARDLSFYALILNYALLSGNNKYDQAINLQNKILRELDNTSLIFFHDDIYVQFYCNYAKINLAFGKYTEAIESLKNARVKSPNIQTKQSLNFLIDTIEVFINRNNADARKLKKTLAHLIKILSYKSKTNFLKMLLNILWHSVATNCFDLFAELAASVVKICGNAFDELTITNVYLQIVKANLDKNKQHDYINKILFILKDKKAPLTKAILKQQLAFLYFQKRKYALGITILVNVQNLIRDFIADVPREFQAEVFNLYYFKVSFQIVYDFLKNNKIQIGENIFNEKVSTIGFKRLISSNDLALINNNKNFLQMLSSEVFYESSDILKYQTLSKTFQHFTLEPETNINLLLNFLMQKIFALYSNILTTLPNGKQTVLFPTRVARFKFFDYAEVLNNFDFSKIKNMLAEVGFNLIEIPIGSCKNVSGKSYSLIFFIQTDIYILSKNRLNYCKKFIPLLKILLQNCTLNNLLTLEQNYGTTYIRNFEQALKASINYSNLDSTNIIVAYFKIENLKVIDFLFGQQYCDKIVKEVVAIVNGLLTKNEVIAKYAKDEFAILFYDELKNDVIKKVNEIKEKTLNLEHKDINLLVPLTFGLASLDDDGVTLHNIINKAYVAMMHSTEQGVNKTSVYSSSYESNLINKPVFATLYSSNEALSFTKINCIIELLLASSSYVSKTAMLNLFLRKLLYFLNTETASFLYSDILQKDSEKILTVKSDTNIPDVEINRLLIRQATENLEAFFTDEVKLNNIDELSFPTWQSVLVCPITRGYTLKGFLYLTTSAKKEHFTDDDLAFVSIVGILLGKEL